VKRSQRQQAVCALALAGICVIGPLRAQEAPPTQAQAQPQPEATRFEFRAPVGCSSAEDFAARVRSRSARIRLVAGAAAKRSLVVDIQEPSAGVLRGTVTVVEPDGATRTRQLKAGSCAEAVDALSLIATVTLDPDAMLGEPAPEPEPKPKPEPPRAARRPAEPPHPPPAPPQEPFRLSFGLAASALLNMAPEPAFGGAASAALELNPGQLLAPFLRLSLTHAQRRGLAAGAGDANFAFTLPTLDACPVRLGPRAFGVRPCVSGSVGLLRVWGSGAEATRLEDHLRVYGAAGAALWLGVRVSEAFEIIADGRALLPFWRDQFTFDDVVFYRTIAPAFSAGVGVAGGFP
jgi:hypothetical protein